MQHHHQPHLQEEQVQAFRNAAHHLQPVGVFVVENYIPQIQRLPVGADRDQAMMGQWESHQATLWTENKIALRKLLAAPAP